MDVDLVFELKQLFLKFVEALRAEGIPCNAGYKPLYHYPFLPSCKPLPNVEKASTEEAVWIPQYVLLSEKEDLEDVQNAIEKIRRHALKIPK